MSPRALCELELGVFVRRRCAEFAQGECASCRRRACGLHLRAAPAPVCFDCAPRQPQPEPPRPAPARQRTHETDLFIAPHQHVFDDWSAPAASGAAAAAAWQGGGGRSGGGGASESFGDPSPFAPDDYAAFDRVGDHDRRLGLGSYDS